MRRELSLICHHYRAPAYQSTRNHGNVKQFRIQRVYKRILVHALLRNHSSLYHIRDSELNRFCQRRTNHHKRLIQMHNERKNVNIEMQGVEDLIHESKLSAHLLSSASRESFEMIK